jgi:hypothetical protein
LIQQQTIMLDDMQQQNPSTVVQLQERIG